MAKLPRYSRALLLHPVSNGKNIGFISRSHAQRMFFDGRETDLLGELPDSLQGLVGTPALLASATPEGDVYFSAAGTIVNTTAVEQGFVVELSEGGSLPAVDDDEARLLSFLSPSLPLRLLQEIERFAMRSREYSALGISLRDYRIIRDATVFFEATVLHSLLEAFPDILRPDIGLRPVIGTTHLETWSNAVDAAITLVEQKLIVPAELARQAAAVWRTLASDTDATGGKTFDACHIQTPEAKLLFVPEETEKLSELFGATYVDGRVRSQFVLELRQRVAEQRHRKDKYNFAKRFPYPGNLDI